MNETQYQYPHPSHINILNKKIFRPFFGVGGDGQNIKPEVGVFGVAMQKFVSSLQEVPDLFFVNAFFGHPILPGRSKLDFYEMRKVVFFGYDINFVMRVPPVSVQNGITLFNRYML